MIIGRYRPPGSIPEVGHQMKTMEASPERISRHYTKLSLTCVRPHRRLIGNFNVIGRGCVRMLGYHISPTGWPTCATAAARKRLRLSKALLNRRTAIDSEERSGQVRHHAKSGLRSPIARLNRATVSSRRKAGSWFQPGYSPSPSCVLGAKWSIRRSGYRYIFCHVDLVFVCAMDASLRLDGVPNPTNSKDQTGPVTVCVCSSAPIDALRAAYYGVYPVCRSYPL